MNNLYARFQSWPRWLRITFAVFGYGFIFALIWLVTRQVFFAAFNSSLTQKPPLTSDFDVYVWLRTYWLFGLSSGWALLTLQFLVAVIGIQGIILTFKHESGPRAVRRGIVFAVATALIIFAISVLHAKSELEARLLLVPPGNVAVLPAESTDMPGQNNFVVYITTLTGLVTAVAGLYGQITSARKASLELELEKIQLENARKKSAPRKKK